MLYYCILVHAVGVTRLLETNSLVDRMYRVTFCFVNSELVLLRRNCAHAYVQLRIADVSAACCTADCMHSF